MYKFINKLAGAQCEILIESQQLGIYAKRTSVLEAHTEIIFITACHFFAVRTLSNIPE